MSNRGVQGEGDAYSYILRRQRTGAILRKPLQALSSIVGRSASKEGGDIKVMNKVLSVVIPVAAIATVAFMIGQFAGTFLAPQEVYAPSGRRGYFCEFRPEQQLSAAYPIQAEIMAQTIADQGGIGLLYMH